MNMSAIEGMIFNIQRDSTEDGPGIRTTVFMKGCSLHCPWCHNPEGIKSNPELVWYETRCVGAGKCVNACSKNALAFTQNGVIIDRDYCNACGKCAKVCPANALEVIGRNVTVDGITSKILRDKVFYEKSGGGVTISGGEPAMQADFATALMRNMQQKGIHLALDTCGGMNWKILHPLVELADLVLYDIKLMDRNNHLRYTGIPLDLVLDNALEIVKMEKPIWVRTPIIPNYTDSEENIRCIAGFIKNNLPTARRYELIAFNNSCAAKYQRLGQVWNFNADDLIQESKMIHLADTARSEGLEFVYWSGMTIHGI